MIKNALQLIAAERRRQVEEEGFGPEHDDKYINNELLWAAACYAAPQPIFILDLNTNQVVDPWPWDKKWDGRPRKPVIDKLVIAGALLCAEIEREMRFVDPAKEGVGTEEVLSWFEREYNDSVEEGMSFDPEQDAAYGDGNMARVAAWYIAPDPILVRMGPVYASVNPWPPDFNDRSENDEASNREYAGALICAEIERLLKEAKADLAKATSGTEVEAAPEPVPHESELDAAPVPQPGDWVRITKERTPGDESDEPSLDGIEVLYLGYERDRAPYRHHVRFDGVDGDDFYVYAVEVIQTTEKEQAVPRPGDRVRIVKEWAPGDAGSDTDDAVFDGAEATYVRRKEDPDEVYKHEVRLDGNDDTLVVYSVEVIQDGEKKGWDPDGLVPELRELYRDINTELEREKLGYRVAADENGVCIDDPSSHRYIKVAWYLYPPDTEGSFAFYLSSNEPVTIEQARELVVQSGSVFYYNVLRLLDGLSWSGSDDAPALMKADASYINDCAPVQEPEPKRGYLSTAELMERLDTTWEKEQRLITAVVKARRTLQEAEERLEKQQQELRQHREGLRYRLMGIVPKKRKVAGAPRKGEWSLGSVTQGPAIATTFGEYQHRMEMGRREPYASADEAFPMEPVIQAAEEDLHRKTIIKNLQQQGLDIVDAAQNAYAQNELLLSIGEGIKELLKRSR